MTVTIVDKDLGFKRIVREVNARKNSYTEVGYQGDEKERYTKARVVDVAAFNEFGTERSPQRSFMRTAFDRVQLKLDSIISKLYKDVLLGKIGTKKSLQTIGEFMKSEMQKQIDMTVSPPNAPSTIKNKGSTHPLIDTGQMRQSIQHKETIKR